MTNESTESAEEKAAEKARRELIQAAGFNPDNHPKSFTAAALIERRAEVTAAFRSDLEQYIPKQI